MLEKYYQPNLVEGKIYKKWENEGDFKPSSSSDDTFSIVIPPQMLLVHFIWATP